MRLRLAMVVIEELMQTEGVHPSALVVAVSTAANVAVAVAVPTMTDIAGITSAAAKVTHHDSTVEGALFPACLRASLAFSKGGGVHENSGLSSAGKVIGK